MSRNARRRQQPSPDFGIDFDREAARAALVARREHAQIDFDGRTHEELYEGPPRLIAYFQYVVRCPSAFAVIEGNRTK